MSRPSSTRRELAVEVEHPSFEDWWQPFELGVGPAGSYIATLGQPERRRLEERCRELLGLIAEAAGKRLRIEAV